MRSLVVTASAAVSNAKRTANKMPHIILPHIIDRTGTIVYLLLLIAEVYTTTAVPVTSSYVYYTNERVPVPVLSLSFFPLIALSTLLTASQCQRGICVVVL